MKKHLNFALRGLFSLVILSYIFYIIDIEKLFLAVGEVSIIQMLPVFFLFFITLGIMILKWRILLKKFIPVGIKKIIFIYWASKFINVFGLGAIGGEAYKALSFDKKKQALLSSLTDKALSLYWYLLVALSALISFFLLKESSVPRMAFSTSIICILLIMLSLGINSSKKTIGRFLSFPGAKKIKEALRSIDLKNKELLEHACLSVLLLLNSTLIYTLVFRALDAGNIFMRLLIFVPILKIGITLPISVQGLGISEFLFLKFAGISGIDPEVALLTSLLVYFLKLFFSMTGMIPFLFFGKRTRS